MSVWSMRSSSALRSTRLLTSPTAISLIPNHRHASSAPSLTPNPASVAAKLNPRWLSDTKTRLGACIRWGMTNEQTVRAGLLLREVSEDWLQLLAGSEGYLSSPQHAGLRGTPITWGSQDVMGHVNNVTYVRYAETGRTNWSRQVGEHFDREHKQLWADLLTSRGVGLILKSITVDYKFPMTWPDRVTVMHKLRGIPGQGDGGDGTSMLLDVMMVSHGKQRVVARAKEDVVIYDYPKQKKTQGPEWMMKQFERQVAEQNEEQRLQEARVRKILDQVTKLEKETWDRPDAVEM